MITIRLIDAAAGGAWTLAVILQILDTLDAGGELGRWAVLLAIVAATLTSAAMRCRTAQSRAAGVQEGLRMAGVVKLSDHEKV